jgi:hypothetical protein
MGSPDSMETRRQIEAAGILLRIDERPKYAEKHSRKEQGDYHALHFGSEGHLTFKC